jgi:hypothetical protein
MTLPGSPEQLQELEDAAQQVRLCADADNVNALVNRLRHAFDGSQNADVYCALSHLIAMLALSEEHGYTIPIITILAMQSRQRHENDPPLPTSH